MSINSHQSGSEEIDGRKSDKRKKSVSTHTLPIREDLINILSMNTDTYNPLNTKQYLFVNKKGDSFFPYSTLNNVWKRARKKAAAFHNDESLKTTELYKAAKHAGVTKLIELGYSDEMILRITGISKEALRHYARLKASDIAEVVEKLASLRERNMGVSRAQNSENLHTSCTQVNASVATHKSLKIQGS